MRAHDVLQNVGSNALGVARRYGVLVPDAAALLLRRILAVARVAWQMARAFRAWAEPRARGRVPGSLAAARNAQARVVEVARSAIALGRDALGFLRRRSARLVRARLALPLAVAAVALGFGAIAVARVLPDPRELEAAPLALPSSVHDWHGGLLYTFEEERRELVKLDEVPLVLQQATIAIEDRTFWSNLGIDVGGIVRAALANLREGEITQGGSTITQQLVKARVVGNERSFDRKIREAILAIRVTQTYSKREILERYFNQVYYGNRSYGVRTAAKSYFRVTDLRALTLGQAALLAGLPQRPSVYDPVVNPDAARARRAAVLDAMVEAGFIGRDAAAAAEAEPIVVRAATTSILYPHVVFRVREEVARILGSERAAYVGGYRIYTTIDPMTQGIAERQVRERVAALRGNNVHNAALIALDPRTGHILAYVGSVDYAAKDDPKVRGDFDVAGLGERQMGSAFKLFTYLTGLRKGYTASTVLWDVSTNFAPAGQPAYRPKNAPSHWGASPENGPLTLRQAIRESLNVPAVKMAALVGLDEIIETARILGVQREWDRSRIGLAFALGAGEMTLRELAGAYQVVANGGKRIAPTLVARIEDAEGRPVYDTMAPRGEQVVSPQLAWIMTDLLKDTTDPNTSVIFGSWTNIGRTAALKTGTSDELRDVLAVGYVPELLTAVWMGNSDNSEMSGITSAMAPGVLWRDFMREVLVARNVGPSWYARPDGIVERTVCARPGPYGGSGTGFLPSSLCPSSMRTVEKFAAGTEPRMDDRVFWGRGCLQPRAERPEWQQDLGRWAAAFKNTRLGVPICGFARPTPERAPDRDDDRKGRKRR